MSDIIKEVKELKEKIQNDLKIVSNLEKEMDIKKLNKLLRENEDGRESVQLNTEDSK